MPTRGGPAAGWRPGGGRGAVVGPRGGIAMGPRGWIASTGNVYNRWGSASALSRRSAGYDARTGNVWTRQVGVAYNSRTGTIAAGDKGSVTNAFTGNKVSGGRSFGGGRRMGRRRGVARRAASGDPLGSAGRASMTLRKGSGAARRPRSAARSAAFACVPFSGLGHNNMDGTFATAVDRIKRLSNE
jgi:hypothetical protein